MAIKLSIILACLVVALSCGGAPSDEKPADKFAESVGKTLMSLAAGYNARDAKAISETFTTTGEFVDGSGNVFQGRDAIAREFAALFEVNPKNSIAVTADDIREISPGILAADCVAQLVAGERAEGKEADHVDFAAILIKQADGRWLIGSIRSEGERSPPTPKAHLKRLEWLIGEWVEESNESTMHTNSRWSEDGNFILTDFAIHAAGRKLMTGTQRIGWDASQEKFRSWVFDSDGGYAEGIWTELEDHWVVKSTGVRPDGLVGSATTTYAQTNSHAYVFSVTDRLIGDEEQPDFIAHVVRKPPQPESGAPTAPRSTR